MNPYSKNISVLILLDVNSMDSYSSRCMGELKYFPCEQSTVDKAELRQNVDYSLLHRIQ